jgi:hypothetical protein
MEYLFGQGIRNGYWLRIEMENIELVPLCVKDLGFYIHHATKVYVMLVKWTDSSRANPIPNPSMHQVCCRIPHLSICLFLGRSWLRDSS